MKIYYKRHLKNQSRELRKNSTLAEILLWNELKGRKMLGYQFMRQKPIDKYIVDFYSSKLKLISEIDGTSHYGKEGKDKRRQEELERLGLSFLRFDDLDVKFKMDEVLNAIKNWIEKHEQPPRPL
ncbi:MAG: endonuclease domain-containing protein [Ignavibacteriaceae bacterium]